MPQQQPTAYDALGRPIIDKAKNLAINEGVKWGWQNYGKPAWDAAFNSGTTAAAEGTAAGAASGAGATVAGTGATVAGGGFGAAGGYGAAAGAGGYGTAAASSGAASLGAEGVGMTLGGAFSVIAPIIMGYLKYQAGSGRNEPLEKRAETQGSGKLLSDLAAGKKIDPNSTLENYGLRTKMLPPWMTGGEETTVDPRGYTAYDLYSRMHDIGTGRPQTGGLGNSGYSDQQIDDMMGPDKGKIATLLGLAGLPDWGKHDWNKGFAPGVETPYSKMNPQVKMNEGWAKTTPELQRAYLDASMVQEPGSPNDQLAQQIWEQDQQQAEVEKLLGRKLSRRMAVPNPDAENVVTNY